MADNLIDRARVIMARIKDDTSPLDSKAAGNLAIKYANSFLILYRPDLLKDSNGNSIDIGTIDNETKAIVYVNQLREFHKNVLSASRVPSSASIATVAEQALVDVEFPIDLGAEEENG